MQIEAMQRFAMMSGDGRGARIRGGASYAGAMAIGLTIGGAIAIQIRGMLDGKDPEDMGPENRSFWLRALFTGGGLGLLGDFVNANQNRFGQGITDMIVGPAAAMVSDFGKLTLGNGMEALRGEETNAGREAVQFAGRYTPLLSSWWATRAAYRRCVSRPAAVGGGPEGGQGVQGEGAEPEARYRAGILVEAGRGSAEQNLLSRRADQIRPTYHWNNLRLPIRTPSSVGWSPAKGC